MIYSVASESPSGLLIIAVPLLTMRFSPPPHVAGIRVNHVGRRQNLDNMKITFLHFIACVFSQLFVIKL